MCRGKGRRVVAGFAFGEGWQKLLALEPTLGELEKALGIPKAREELSALQKETEQDGFWNNLERSQKVSQQIKRLENKIKKHDKLVSEWEDTLTLCEMAQEEDDPSQLEEVTNGYETLEKEISERRLAALLSGDQNTFELFRCEAPELVHLPEATFQWYCENYLDRDYPLRTIMRLNGVEFPEKLG